MRLSGSYSFAAQVIYQWCVCYYCLVVDSLYLLDQGFKVLDQVLNVLIEVVFLLVHRAYVVLM